MTPTSFLVAATRAIQHRANITHRLCLTSTARGLSPWFAWDVKDRPHIPSPSPSRQTTTMNPWPLPLSLSLWGVFSKSRQRSSDRWENETGTAAVHLLEPPTALLVCVDLLLQSSPLNGSFPDGIAIFSTT